MWQLWKNTSNTMIDNRLYIVLISLGITAIVMLWDSSEKIITPPKYGEGEEKRYPYAVAEGASTRYFGEHGGVDYSFTATKLEHFLLEGKKNDGLTEEYTLITKPHFVIYEQHEPWHIESENGKLMRTTEEITLWDNVRIWQDLSTLQDKDKSSEDLPPPNNGETANTPKELLSSELITSLLTIDPIENVAHTEEPVKISSPYGVINAVGMTADFKQRKIKLHKQIKAIHKIPKQAEEK
ncbi:lipopolysaccharide export system protein LptC [Alteromonadaceae bacterium Bs31]|nr:lipopolysaccharide export system protein LptC [Alteromonadaceae bacterium Bs31]